MAAEDFAEVLIFFMTVNFDLSQKNKMLSFFDKKILTNDNYLSNIIFIRLYIFFGVFYEK